MSNIKTTQEEWAAAKKLFEAGKLLRVISERTGITIPSLSKRAKKEGWIKVGEEAEPVHQPDDDVAKKVKTMAAFGLVDDEIASVLSIKLNDLRKNYERELVTANAEMVARVAQSMFKMATDPNKPNVTAAIFWLKCRGGWNDGSSSGEPGIKEQRNLAASKVAQSSKFAPATPPKLVVHNK